MRAEKGQKSQRKDAKTQGGKCGILWSEWVDRCGLMENKKKARQVRRAWSYRLGLFEDLPRFFDVLQRLMPEVRVVQFSVMSALLQQLVVAALLDDRAIA